MQESQQSIDRSASHLGLLVRDARELKSDFQGEVVAVANHHVLLRISELVAVRYEKATLDQSVSMGDKAFMRHVHERTEVNLSDKDTGRTRSHGMSADMEREFR